MNSEVQSAAAEKPSPRLGSPLGLIAILMLVLFFQGCESKGITLTLGPVVPFLAFLYDDDGPWQSQFIYFSLGRAILNLGVLAAVFLIAPRWIPHWANLVRSRRYQVAAMLVAIVFNLVLIAEGVWINLVFAPIGWICDRIDQFIDVAEGSGPFMIAAVARSYFVACWAAIYGLMCLALFVGERYLGFDRRRWWQFNLRILLAIMFVVGTVLGIALRCLAEVGRG